ncbi:hypothetical protein BUE93_18570 [Chromobacterium amazonense]|uniref:Hydrolase or metal-binding protein n=1 Tax=Chromobacterium amazonense TaxID=1382803 RepID=A0A2S9X0D2_9NEIS|nr:hypothetical protein [Chromobacterium amazonense]PRP69179.1 hypothetical protein BUE93_18570 [Chromobacterium amazonense]
MIKGLAITPPVIGRISIGKLVQRQDKLLPEKDDSFTLTTQVQNRDGWLLHPLHQPLAEQAHNGKIRAIPVRLPFNHSELNLRAEYSAFDRATGRPLCVGNGETARRITPNGVEETACAGPEHCPFAREAGCKLYGRLNVQVDGQQDELGTFIFRTTGYNSVRTLAARLHYFEAASGGLTRYLPLTLRLRAKSTTQSYRTPVYYVDLTLRDGHSLIDAVTQARTEAEQALQAGVDTAQMEAMARQLLQNGQFEESEEDVPQLLEEFYPEAATPGETPPPATPIRPARLSRQLGKAAQS